MWIKVRVPDSCDITNFSKHIKEKYNLRLNAIIKVLIDHPELLQEINDYIDKDDVEFRFQKYMDK